MRVRKENITVPETDKLTGLLNRRSFCEAVDRTIQAEPEWAAEGGFAVICFDVIRFKAINELFGTRRGDKLLQYIASVLSAELDGQAYAARINADRFAVFMRHENGEPERLLERLSAAVTGYDLPFETTFNAGIYVTCVEMLTADAMMDRANLAQATIKGSYTVKYRYYDESMRSNMLSEHEIEGMIASALREKQFVIYYQPQYSHSTGRLIGAEALVRWRHSERGMILPGVFVPIFERNGFITELDLYVFEQACAMLRRSMDEMLPIVPLSTNFSRYDIFHADFVDKLEDIRSRYNIPAKYLHIELTETVFIGGSKRMNTVIDQLHEHGYTVQMDDFGSGYSSLNVLKDTDVDCFKLDMDFLSGSLGPSKGGTILGTVVRMAKWLGVRVIAEGVETREQADFLRSIGCDCMQGFLYSRPLPEEEYLMLLRAQGTSHEHVPAERPDMLSVVDFFNPASQETLIFSRFAGPAAIFEYHAGQVEILRVNPKYIAEIGMNHTEHELIGSDPLAVFDDENRDIYLDMLESIIRTGEEQECATWRSVASACCGMERMYIRSTVRLIARSQSSFLFFAAIRNMTNERREMERRMDNERRFQVASEQVNIYYWEYDVAKREMRPCFRCMRDLGLPAVLTNYPESAFEMGVFPPEVHDLYRSWHRQVDAGVPELEAIMPLTDKRIPFRVRYTTEFDDYGRPVRAYGSAALVKDAAALPAELDSLDDKSKRSLELIAQHSDRVVLLYDIKAHKIRFSDGMDDQYGMNNSSVDELFAEGRIMPESAEGARRILRNIARGVPFGRENIRFKYRENYTCWLDFKYTTIFDDDKKPTGAFLSYIDITDTVEARRRSQEDGMTGLLNRATAEEKIRAQVGSAVRPGVLMLMDMDGLKAINDTFGHQEGDRAICSVAQTLKTHFRASDVIGRFGGDEFVAYLGAAAGSRLGVSKSIYTLLDKIAQLGVGENGEACVHCSVGCAEQEAGLGFDELYRRADAALYYAKRHGKNQLAYYEAGMEERT